ncbi:MAG: 16S rRNA (guanine(966)-N(2))-methyltransferase RsmD [Candidatus Brocadiia bacterium]
MRVISGIAKGRRLAILPGHATRSLTDRVKSSLFSIIQNVLEGSEVLDLYCGAASFGIEAVSRGARSAVCVDSAWQACEVAKSNVVATGFASGITIVKSEVVHFVRSTMREDTEFDIVFADPPFQDLGEADSSVLALAEIVGTVVKDDGILVIRVHRKAPAPKVTGMILTRRHELGLSHLLFYRQKGMTR